MTKRRSELLKRAGAILASSGLTTAAVYFLMTRTFDLPEQATLRFLLFSFGLITAVVVGAVWRAA